MNDKYLLKILAPFIIHQNLKTKDLTDVTWKAEDSSSSSVLFYNLRDTIDEKNEFLKRLEKNKYGVLITVNDDILSENLDNLIVLEKSNWLKAQKIVLDHFYPMPKIKLVGITGTNGKTTTTDLARQISNLWGHRAFSIGTLGVIDAEGNATETNLTTPPYIWIRKFLYELGKNHEVGIMEISSHALVQKRVYELTFDEIAWTSFSQDHLDYHKTLPEYFAAKELIYEHVKPSHKMWVPHRETELLKKLSKRPVSETADITSMVTNSKLPIFFQNDFNKNNFELAYSINKSLWNSDKKVDLTKLIPPAGRYSAFESANQLFIIDFAHTPDALENICSAIRKDFSEKPLTVVFGCGGNRDRTKRPLMGKVVEKYAEKIIITNDNPRFETPEVIAADARKGVQGDCEIILDRKKAIKHAAEKSSKNAIILIAGKGHEEYIQIEDIKHPYSDYQVVQEIIESRK
ncbi:MAG: hypothetical protein JNM93_10060 [Bacteriovoracaceae bacterium]|nr:hypothetical protein [Bacteriovoracaceae bacterium]